MSQQVFKKGDVVKVTSPPSDTEWEVLGEHKDYPGMLKCRQLVGGVELPISRRNPTLVRPADGGDAS